MLHRRIAMLLYRYAAQSAPDQSPGYAVSALTAAATGAAARYAAVYGGIFLIIGIMLPFWPLWLKSRGLDATEIGIIFAIGAWVRVLTDPFVTHAADRSGNGRRLLIVCAALCLLGFSGFIPAWGFWVIATVTFFQSTFLRALIPLSESQTMAAVLADRLDYGRIRLWGSITFIVGALGTGWLLDVETDPNLVLWLVLGAAALTLAATVLLPDRRGKPLEGGLAEVLPVLRDRPVLAFLVAASLIQASHAVLYGFGTLHWTAAGHSETLIGWLWAGSVIVEIVLFAVSGPIIARAGSMRLVMFAALAGIVRWLLFAWSTTLPALIVGQVLHAATFAAAHLAAMHFIARNAPPGLSATSQGVYAAIAGTVMGLSMFVSGGLYERFGGMAFVPMALMCAVSLCVSVALWTIARRRD
jgi:PPP family 3-phenylpropionic acid transporter